MKCPQCDAPMEEGRVEVHGTAAAAIVTGTALQDLYWYDKKRTRASKRRIVDSKQAKAAFGCKPCGLVTVDTTTQLKGRFNLRRN